MEYVLWQYLEILKFLKTNQRSVTIFGVTYHVNIKQFEILFRT